MSVVAAVATGCGVTTKDNMVHKLQTEVQTLDVNNYKSTATMTVQMDNNPQTYYVETWFEAPDVYRIQLGDANKHINQIIVRNQNGMFIVSPALQKVFRFNGNWAQNQGHIYLYDQVLQQIIAGKDVKMSKAGDNYVFEMPVESGNDVVVKQRVEIAGGSLHPKRIVLYDKDNKPVLTVEYTSFQTGVKFDASNDFDPHKLVSDKKAKQTVAADQNIDFGYVEPGEMFGDKLAAAYPDEVNNETVLRYTGPHSFTLDEWRPEAGVDGFASAQLVDLFGVPAMYTGDTDVHQLIWVNNGVEFALTSKNLTLEQMRRVAMSTLAQVGK